MFIENKIQKVDKMTKKSLLAIAAILMFGSSMTVEAKTCIGCSAQLPDNANFCSQCMTPQPMSAQLGVQNSNNKEPREVILDMFAFLDQYEAYFYDLQYLNVLGKMPEIKTMFNNASVRYKRIEQHLPEECKLLANIYAAKYQIFDGLANLMKNMRMDGGYKAALLQSSLVVIQYYNEIISEFRTPQNWNPENIAILKKQIQNVSEKTQKYNVTAKYLKLGETKVPSGESVMVLGINDKNALVMYMGPTLTYNAVQGSVSLSNLEKRTTWKKTNEFYFQPIKLK